VCPLSASERPGDVFDGKAASTKTTPTNATTAPTAKESSLPLMNAARAV